MSMEKKVKATRLIAFVLVSVAVAGYFTGLQAPMKASTSSPPRPVEPLETESTTRLEVGVIPATPYAGIAGATSERRRHTRLASLKSAIDPLAEISIALGDKPAAFDQREQNRSFNGAPPTIPHPVDQRSDASCVACHKEGAMTKSLRIPRMSHAFLANCTQCHVENNPRHMTAFSFRENDFAGLVTPTEGPRAFSGAPPQIPHSTWMRSDCLSCHGHAGQQGIRTTHPWRKNCQQCHAPSASLDQTLLAVEPQFLPGPEIKE
ncbi:MAG: cytochrome c-type protein NapB [Planctomycetaceae bacterium]|jgi:cytochrome c-type protein NapB